MTLAGRDRLFGHAMAAPALAALFAVVLLPLALALATSAFDYTLPDPRHDRFVGLGHYLAALGSPELRRSLLVTLAFVAAVVGIGFAAGLAAALALAAVGRGARFYQAVLLLPLALSPVAVGLVWRLLLQPSPLGLAGPAGWLGDPRGAFWALVLADAWQHASLAAVLLFAGITALPREHHEAARMEGAGALGRFLHVTLPLLRPAIAATLLVQLLLAVRTFDLVHVMTRGGPGQATDLVSHFAYRQAFVMLDLGRACAVAAVPLLIVLPLAVWLHRRLRQLSA